jgi:hypothetical protein
MDALWSEKRADAQAVEAASDPPTWAEIRRVLQDLGWLPDLAARLPDDTEA